MGGRSGQGVNRGSRTQQQPERTVQELVDERERLQADTDLWNRRLQNESNYLRDVERQTPEQIFERTEAIRERRDEAARELEKVKKELEDKSAKPEPSQYNATISESGTNRFPQYSSDDFTSFTGVPKDFGGTVRIEYNQNGATVYVNGEGVSMQRNINFDGQGKPDYVYNAYFKIDDGSPHDSRGAEIFNNQVTTLRNQGFNRIEVSAAGAYNDNATFNGYYTWARFGYVPNDANLGVNAFNQYAQQNGLEQVSNFKEIMYTSAGREYWKNKGGQSFRGTFNLNKNSYSSTTMDNYMKERANR
jgi:hypothetical protein